MVNITKINGPVNVFRLEGKIAGINKVIYLFAEFHDPLHMQTKCPDLHTKDISNYILEQFDNILGSDKTVDFFFELPRGGMHDPEDMPDEEIRTHPYIDTIDMMIKQIARIPEYRKNVRLHSMDIRDYIMPLQYTEFVGNMFMDNFVFNVNAIEQTLYKLSIMCQQINRIMDIYKNAPKTSYSITLDKSLVRIRYGDIPEEDMIEHTKNIMHKLKYRYHNDSVRDKIRKKMEQVFKDAGETCGKINKYMDKYDSYRDIISYRSMLPPKYRNERDPYSLNDDTVDMLTITIIKFYQLYNHIRLYPMLITDLYFIRRFLDKPYITNGAIYGGFGHATNYLTLLVKDFGFRITHVAYSKVDINELNTIAKKSTKELVDVIYPPKPIQCSDIQGFPEAFQ